MPIANSETVVVVVAVTGRGEAVVAGRVGGGCGAEDDGSTGVGASASVSSAAAMAPNMAAAENALATPATCRLRLAGCGRRRRVIPVTSSVFVLRTRQVESKRPQSM